MEDIIKADPTLNYLINEAHFNLFDTWQVHVRCQAIKLTLQIYLDKKYPTNENV